MWHFSAHVFGTGFAGAAAGVGATAGLVPVEVDGKRDFARRFLDPLAAAPTGCDVAVRFAGRSGAGDDVRSNTTSFPPTIIPTST